MELTLTELTDSFCATKLTEGLSPKTVTWYKWLLGKFIATLPEDKLPAFTLQATRDFVASLQARETRYENHPFSPKKEGGLSPYTISCYVRTLKVFSVWLLTEEYTRTDVLARLKRPKLPEPIVDVLTDQKVQNLVGSINANTFLGSRTFAIVLLLLDTGIRATELCTLTLESTNLQDGEIKVMGKGRKERIIPIGAGTKKALLKYVSTFRPESTHPYLFLTDNGTPVRYDALKLLIARLSKKSGVTRLHLHLFRHTFAVDWLMNGGDLMSLERMLGHTTISTTQMYLHLAESHIKTQYNRTYARVILTVGDLSCWRR